MVAPFFWKNKIFRTLVGNFFVECSFFSGICEDSGFLFHAYKDKIIAIYYDILSRVNRPATKEFKKKTMKVTVAFIFFLFTVFLSHLAQQINQGKEKNILHPVVL